MNDVLKDKIVYDAATTPAGSSGSLFDGQGKVIGIKFAILEGFGGSKFSIAAKYANDLLK